MKQNSQTMKGLFIKRFILVLALSMGMTAMSYAQQRISGTVKDASGEPVVGASVVVKGTSNGVFTDVDGKFTLDCPANSQLEVSFLGFLTQTVAAKNPVNVTLEEDQKQLDEVVMVGYGTMRRTDLTGTSTNVKAEAITTTIAANPITALQGKSSGLTIFTNSKPGENPGIRIRGTGTIDSNSDPLYVVDGFPLMDGDLNDINAADIESMEVLKDASSTAIYGSRGANGVIIITTKSGRKDSHNVTVDLGLGIQKRARLMNLLTGQEYLDYTGQAAPANGVWTNWQEECIQATAITQNYNASVDGQAGKTGYMVSAGYYNQDGLQLGQGFYKYSVRSNLTHEINKIFSVGANMQLTESRQNRGLDNALGEVGRMGFPNQPVKNDDGSWNILTGAAVFNPVMELEAVNSYADRTRFIGNWFANVNIVKGLSYKLQIGYDVRNAHGYRYVGSQDPHNVVKGATGSGSQSWSKNRTKLMDNIFTYTNKWGDHRFTVTGVYSYMDYRSENTSTGIESGGDDVIQVWSLGSYTDKTTLTYSSGFNSNRLISFTGRANYVYADRYILTATARYDGSSRFGRDSKWGLFPSVGLAWRVTEESFLKDNDVLTNLKVRGTWGVTGNQEIGNYKSLSHIESSASNSYTDGSKILGGYIETVGNANLQWERTTQVDVGIDLSLWNRLNVVFDWYNRNTDNLLYEVPIPSETGYQKLLSNVGMVNNTGFEVTVGGDIYKNKNWGIDASVNFSTNQNVIKELYGDVERIDVRSGTTGIAQILEVGKPVNGVWTRKSLGIMHNQAELDAMKNSLKDQYAAAGIACPAYVDMIQLGDEVYQDTNMDGSINVNDYICNGSIEPKYYYGINLNAHWRKLQLSVYGQGAWNYAAVIGDNDNSSGFSLASMQNLGNYVYDADNCIAGNNYIPTVEGYHAMWSATNPEGTSPRRGFATFYSDRTHANWSYFVLRNIQLGYDFSDLMKQNKLGIKGLTFNVNLQNFLAVTDKRNRGYNPETGDVSTPWGKTIMFGLKANF